MIVTLLVLGAVLLSILGIVALSIAPRRMFALDDSSIHTPAQLDAAMSIQRTMHIAELQRRTTDTSYLSYALLGLAFLMQMVALAVDHLAHLSIAVIGMVPAMVRAFLLAASLSGALIACSSNKAIVPPILQGATAQGGWWGACPPGNQTEADSIKAMHQLALSPQFNERLKKEFPAGSSEQTLVESLRKQGFRDAGYCKSDQSIKLATFYAKGSGILPYATIAEAYWQTDGDHIVWTKGFVRYSGL